MRNLLAALSLACLLGGTGLAFTPLPPGKLATAAEANRAMGAATCWTTNDQTENVCFYNYQTKQWCGGCGCTTRWKFVSGSFSPAAATPCGTSLCTAPQSVTSASCGLSPH
jgi:hypothetical protein